VAKYKARQAQEVIPARIQAEQKLWNLLNWEAPRGLGYLKARALATLIDRLAGQGMKFKPSVTPGEVLKAIPADLLADWIKEIEDKLES
jgi:hypothetical protein